MRRALTLIALFAAVGCQPEQPDGVIATPTGAEDSVEHFSAEQFNLEADGAESVDDADEEALAAVLGEDFPEEADEPTDEAEAPPGDRADVYLVRLVWGQLRGDLSVQEITDWTGGVRAQGAAVQVLRTLRFDGRDHIVRPRPGPSALGFVSRTRPHHDGLLLRVVAPRGGEGDLTVRLGEHQRTWRLADLTELTELHAVEHNHVLVQAMQVRPEPEQACAEGFLAGRWRKTRENGGKFAGRWVEADGRGKGFLFGVYGTRANGDRVFVGKYVGPRGGFRGRIAGTWTPAEDGQGEFRGRWINRAGEAGGVLGGGYRVGEGAGRGFLRGRWMSGACAAE